MPLTGHPRLPLQADPPSRESADSAYIPDRNSVRCPMSAFPPQAERLQAELFPADFGSPNSSSASGSVSAGASNTSPRVVSGWPDVGPLRDAQFDWMRVAFSPVGGLLHSEECQRRLRQQTDQPVSRLARAIVARSVLSLSWEGDTWIPAFQFGEDGLTVRPCCAKIFEELEPIFDDWELAWWFAIPNAWLGGDAPVNRLDDTELLLQAARADRFIARG